MADEAILNVDGEDQDPLQLPGQDPWNAANAAAAAAAGAEEPQTTYAPQGAGIFSTGVSPGPIEPPAQRIIHDVPPVWDGKDPDNLLEPYLKLLKVLTD